jgi:hypothetical protein
MTPLGYLLLLVGFACFLLSPKWLYRIFVFSTLFSATAIANFGEGEDASALQVWMLFGSLWLLRLLSGHLLTPFVSIDRRILRPCLWLIAFLAIGSLSLVMPIYINGSLLITDPVPFATSETPLFLTWHNVTQVLYLIFGGAITIAVAHFNLLDRERHETERVILISAIFISIWGLFQLICNLTGVPYPGFLLNNSGSGSGKGYLETMNGIGRVSSAAVEPSMFAIGLISLLPLTLPAWLGRGSVLSVRIDRSCTVLFIVLLVLSTSSTGYVGVLILAALLFPLLLRTRTMSLAKTLKFAAVATAALIAVATIAITSIPIVSDVVNSALFHKYSESSGLARAVTIVQAFGYFQRFPVLGIGWGSATSHDVVFKLLSNVGVLGTFTFFAAMYCVIKANWQTLTPLGVPMSLSRAAWSLGFCTFLFASILNEFPLAFGNFWLILGMAISTSWKADPASPQLRSGANTLSPHGQHIAVRPQRLKVDSR